jgi:hypothetical protein
VGILSTKLTEQTHFGVMGGVNGTIYLTVFPVTTDKQKKCFFWQIGLCLLDTKNRN